MKKELKGWNWLVLVCGDSDDGGGGGDCGRYWIHAGIFFSLGSEPGDESLNWTTNTNFYLMQKWYENNSSGSKDLTYHCYLCSDQVENNQIPSDLFFAELSFSTVDQADQQPIHVCYWNAVSV